VLTGSSGDGTGAARKLYRAVHGARLATPLAAVAGRLQPPEVMLSPLVFAACGWLLGAAEVAPQTWGTQTELTVTGGLHAGVAMVTVPELTLSEVVDQSWAVEAGFGMSIPRPGVPLSVEGSVLGGWNWRVLGSERRQAGVVVDLRALLGAAYFPLTTWPPFGLGVSGAGEAAATWWLGPGVGLTLSALGGLHLPLPYFILGASPFGRVSVGLTF
jgi:hypothetical protein